MTIIPPYLKEGDTIGLVCPAGYMPAEKAATCINVLQQWGFKVKVGKTLGHQFNYFSGTDDERLDDLQQMLDDDKVNAVLCGRGGYGMTRIIDRINFKKFKKKPKWLIGYSDITVFHSHILKNYGIAGLHSPMAAAFNNDEYKNPYVQSLKAALYGVRANYTCDAHPFNNTGKATGKLVGGNLSILTHLIGTSSDIDTKNCILFIEDIGEYIYNIDRMMYQLKRSGKLDKLAGLIIGRFTDVKDTTVPYGQNAFEAVMNIVSGYNFPICYNFPVSHDNENYALKTGVTYKLTIADTQVQLAEKK